MFYIYILDACMFILLVVASSVTHLLRTFNRWSTWNKRMGLFLVVGTVARDPLIGRFVPGKRHSNEHRSSLTFSFDIHVAYFLTDVSLKSTQQGGNIGNIITCNISVRKREEEALTTSRCECWWVGGCA